ncbi:hypothetical protein [Flavitalea sp.]|nr:hypothetical protein [Flavitalea sp.]
MRKFILPYLAALFALLSQPVFSQTDNQTGNDTAILGLAGDNLDLYAVLELFQKSKTIEDFEKSLNDQKTAINNLDLDLDKKVDFIKVVTKENKADSSFSFVLQVAVSKTETQDVAVILIDKNKGKVSLQIVGDEELYGKDYVIEPKTTTPAVTSNPAYVGPEPVVVNVPAKTIVVVETVPIVQYVYSPVYVPYVPPYHYGFYPPYFAAFTVVAVGIYRHNNYHYHGGYHGGHYGGGNTVIINNRNYYNNYNNNKMRSNTVSDNRARGSYGNGSTDRAGTRPSASTRPANGASNRPSVGGPSASTRPSAGASNRPSVGGPSASTRPSTGATTRPSTGSANRPSTGGPSASTRQSAGASNRASGGGRSYSQGPSTSNRSASSMGSGRTRNSGGGGGGGMRGSGGGGRRR